jgi:hypothetical protein
MKSPLVEEIRNNETLIANLAESRNAIQCQVLDLQRKVALLKAGLTPEENLELNPAPEGSASFQLASSKEAPPVPAQTKNAS